MADDNFLISAFEWKKLHNELIIEEPRWDRREIPKVIYIHGNTKTVTYRFTKLLTSIKKAEFIPDAGLHKDWRALPNVYVRYS